MGHLGLWYIDNVNLLVENVFFFPVALQAQREPWAFRIIAQKRLLASCPSVLLEQLGSRWINFYEI